ncbi:hypothetical protein QT970_17705 [Microcoleus sp. herbarium8]|uniref:hypothetical protein n=1 Tax=Microcoleus sp. herbarium8 TaxID=3055436 RepID=UPI002FD3598A
MKLQFSSEGLIVRNASPRLRRSKVRTIEPFLLRLFDRAQSEYRIKFAIECALILSGRSSIFPIAGCTTEEKIVWCGSIDLNCYRNFIKRCGG